MPMAGRLRRHVRTLGRRFRRKPGAYLRGLERALGTKSGLPAEELQAQKKIDGELKTYFTAQGWTYPDPVKASNAT